MIIQYKNLKRAADFIFSLLILVVSIPVVLPILLIHLIMLRENPFFLQTRPGKNDVFFRIIKLKTMSSNRDYLGELLPDHERITKIGNILRRLSIDELPQLLNVLKGDMSLVGPRPLLVEYLPLYDENQKTRHKVRPGITGLAQVNGRNSISWDEKLKLDMEYVKELSFKIDLIILIKTLQKLFKPSDIQASKSVTMPKFNGNNK